jgi:serine/threonine-protein kinase
MLTKAGAKLLDFGLAKLRGPVSPISMSGMTRLATATHDTAQGTILGTVQYMAPEQVEGRQADARSDIWAFGAVLYEMTTGQRPFDGDSPASVIGAILRDHPPSISKRQPLAPRALDDLVERCLVKDPEDRWQSIGDVKHQLTTIAATSSADVREVTGPPRLSPRVSRWLAIAGAVALSSVVVAVATWLAIRSTAISNASPPSSVRLALDLGRDVSFTAGTTVAALSPDGTRIVFVSTGADKTARLSVRQLDRSESLALPGTEGAYNPFFSPDGLSVGFFAGGKLKTTRLDGSAPIALCDAPAGRGASWSEDGRIVAALDTRAGLSIVSSTGAVTSLTELAAGETSHRYPRVLPGGKAVLFTVSSVPGNFTAASIAAAPLDANAPTSRKIVLANAGMSPHYVSTGHLVYVADGKLNAVPFDVDPPGNPGNCGARTG